MSLPYHANGWDSVTVLFTMPASAGRSAHVVEEIRMDPVLAYLDAGSASLFLQLLLGGLS